MTSKKPVDSGAPIEAPSKSERKREAKLVFLLARELVEMKTNILAKMDIPEDLLVAVNKTRGIKSHGARKREILYLSKQLRGIELDAIRTAIEQPKVAAREETMRQHRLEIWRDALISEGDQVLNKLCAHDFPVDRQQLRQLIRNAQREASQNKPPASSRSLFRLLADLDLQQNLPAVVE